MYSTKEILPGEGLEAVPDRTAPESLHPQHFEWCQSAKPQWQMAMPAEDSSLREKQKVPRIAGFRRTTFWLLVTLCVVMALAIGLGAGLGIEKKNNNTKNTG